MITELEWDPTFSVKEFIGPDFEFGDGISGKLDEVIRGIVIDRVATVFDVARPSAWATFDSTPDTHHTPVVLFALEQADAELVLMQTKVPLDDLLNSIVETSIDYDDNLEGAPHTRRLREVLLKALARLPEVTV